MTAPRFWREQPYRYRLMGSRCGNCQRTYFPPRTVCPVCRREALGKLEPHRLSGRGTVTTWTIVRQPADGFELQAPYALALVEMEEGCRVLGQIVDVEASEVKTGLAVEACFRKIRQDGERGILYYGYKFRIARTRATGPVKADVAAAPKPLYVRSTTGR